MPMITPSETSVPPLTCSWARVDGATRHNSQKVLVPILLGDDDKSMGAEQSMIYFELAWWFQFESFVILMSFEHIWFWQSFFGIATVPLLPPLCHCSRIEASGTGERKSRPMTQSCRVWPPIPSDAASSPGSNSTHGAFPNWGFRGVLPKSELEFPWH